MGAEGDVEIANPSSQGELRAREKRRLSDHSQPVASRPFAGRVGGNLEFTLPPDSSEYHELVSKAPDATALFSWRRSFNLSSFNDVDTWKEAGMEGVGTCLLVYLGGLISIGLQPVLTETSLGQITPALFGGLTNIPLLSLFIFTGGPVSGGHFNPLITISTFTARLSSFPRTVLYVCWQCVGAVIAGWLVRASLGAPKETFRTVPGCYIDSTLVTPGEAYVLETMTAFALVFLSFGVGLDPRQKKVFGPALAPILVGTVLGLCSFASGIARKGVSGAALNPARCLGLMAAGEKFEYHHIHWTGDITAAVLNGFLYWLIPPYKPGD